MLKTLTNAALFQIGWFICVAGNSPLWLAVPVVFLIVHLLWIADRGELALIIKVTLIGTLLDSLLMVSGVFLFAQHTGFLIPAWLILLWALLATTLRHCLAWTAKPWWLASLLGAVSAPLSYYAGSKLAGVDFPHGQSITLIGLGILWAGVFPLLQAVAHRRA